MSNASCAHCNRPAGYQFRGLALCPECYEDTQRRSGRGDNEVAHPRAYHKQLRRYAKPPKDKEGQ